MQLMDVTLHLLNARGIWQEAGLSVEPFIHTVGQLQQLQIKLFS